MKLKYKKIKLMLKFIAILQKVVKIKIKINLKVILKNNKMMGIQNNTYLFKIKTKKIKILKLRLKNRKMI
jgi:hypothetical protein